MRASTQWEIVEEAAGVIQAARDDLIRQAAQGEVLHNDDSSMRVLHLAREPSDDRAGLFTSGIVSTQEGARSPCTSPAASAQAKTCATCSNTALPSSPGPFRCAMRCRVTCRPHRRRGDPAGQLSCPWKTAVCGSRREISGAMPLRSGDTGRGL
jgi:hypothetical protein